ncbi:MAG: Divergent AAA domain protein [Methanomassiliicoccales archaeon PtaU1.Bin124]|nr:MAG: Divergent AAA domain protein [Methanomassiliicoccales archaeon PtaU1.Bin124]
MHARKGPGGASLTPTRLLAANVVLILVSIACAVIALLSSAPMSFGLAALVVLWLMLPLLNRGRSGWKEPTLYHVAMVCLIILNLFITLVLSKTGNGWLWSPVSEVATGLIYGIFGYLLVQRAVSGQRGLLESSPLAIAALVLATGVCITTLWEIMEFGLDWLIGADLQIGLPETMMDLTGGTVGSLVFSSLTYTSIRYHKPKFMSDFLYGLVETHQSIFVPESDPLEIMRRLKEGEKEDQEFKSSLRTNLKTGEKDARMEHAVLKTIVAFMNSQGGTLYVGVDDSGAPIGIDLQSFDNKDKFFLHFSNLFKQNVGTEHLPLIEPRIIALDGKDVLQVICHRSRKAVFLKMDNKEQYFIRNGASSVELTGIKMMDNIKNRFG